ncbi:MAG: TetR/AcrR family transcriptional regulator [Deltaproteobacteria bacterium]|nr:TetR/AcrR family transcriptional regulator [Deltaproteobacteria bacterium]
MMIDIVHFVHRMAAKLSGADMPVHFKVTGWFGAHSSRLYNAAVTDSTKEAPKRRDAQENRTRIIQAAREVFASSGFEVPLSTIASRAGVGRATLYRNFPDRFTLAAAIFEDNIAALENLAREHRGRPDAFMTLLSAIVEQQIEVHALFPMLMAGVSTPNVDELIRRAKGLLRAPLRAAVAAGLVRSDLTLTDVLGMLAMISAVVTGDALASSRQQRATRALELLLHGIVPR